LPMARNETDITLKSKPTTPPTRRCESVIWAGVVSE
jgi:hypothetical protein